MTSLLRLALYQPDIPQNAGTILRTAACLGLAVDIIEPTGFRMTDTALKRAGLDYLPAATWERHPSWEAFRAARQAEGQRLVLATRAAAVSFLDFSFAPGDVLLFGRESAGVPGAVHDAADARISIPMRPGLRSLNVAVSAAMVASEALRQLDAFPSASVETLERPA